MKTTFFLLFLFITTNFFGQLTYQLTVVDINQQPLSGLSIFLKEASTKDKKRYTTNNFGVATIELENGTKWHMTIGKMYNYKVIEVAENGIANTSQFLTYDLKRWKRENQPMPDRANIVFTEVTKRYFRSAKPTKTHSVVKLKIKRRNKSPLTNYKVQLTNLKTKTIFHGKTDSQGFAYFLVPFGYEYEVDIDGIESFKYVDVTKGPAYQAKGFFYEPTKIKEIEVNDTITQKISDLKGGTSARYLYKIKVRNSSGELLSDENIYLKMIRSKKTYKGKTDDNGEAVFLLPRDRKYLIDFDFQKDVNVINLTQTLKGGIGSGNMAIVYEPNPKLKYPEQYIPTIEDLLIDEFNNFLKKQITPPEKGKGLRVVLKWCNELVNGKSKEAVLEIGFSANKDKSNIYGPPINISFVVDKSGSMAGYERIEQLQKSLSSFIDALRPNDIASLISFDTKASNLIEAGPLKGRTDEFLTMINSIVAGGGTNIYNGMVMGYEEVLKNMISKGTNRLVLLTDGYGTTEVKVIVDKSKEYNAKGIELSAIGVGQGYNQPLLKLLSTHGGGMFQHVGNALNLQETFKRELSGMLYPVAKEAKVEVIYNNKIIFKQLYGFPFTKRDGNKIEMKLDNIYPGLNKLALVKFDLNKPNKSIEKQPVIVRISYFDYRLNKTVKEEQKAYLKWSETKKKMELILEEEEKKLYAIAVMNQSLKIMADAFSSDDYIKAENAVKRAKEQIEELYPKAKQTDVENLYRTLSEYAGILKQYRLNKIRKKK